ncbi:hypothetical protein [Thermocoleostomius sinensis]|uniref:Uncharacterized protein n=1 Tax=Thermocoleostomius sinensis A174 TaxID=2016057 RepID=A0A9E8Z9I9_9CYAN|nr:hypothetical protein [Thermocoleostomius sinensis]WAL58777.1 hypothetical protein OXH18_16540 [Thermocoleostomius sinensis A174]
MTAIWLLLVGLFWAIGTAYQDGIQRLKQLHRIPCHRCLFFTGEYHLKCTVHPFKALTEDAIDCLDYEPTSQRPAAIWTACSKSCSKAGRQ